MSSTNRSTFRTVATLLVSGVLVSLAIWLVLNRQFALDTFANWTFAPSAQVAAVADRANFTEKGEFVFNATRPEILDKESFNSSCPRQEAGSPILGCYTSNDRIYIYNVTDQQLDGMKEVTAAHELLHAVWFRMGEEQRQQLESELRAAYESRADEKLKERMEYYQRVEPTEFVNELYAILGTEVANLSPTLEEHYQLYFDRSSVLTLFQKYDAIYTQLTDRASALVAEMEAIAAQIDTATERYNADVAAFSADVEQFNQRAAAGDFSSTGQFNAERAALVARSDQLDAARISLNNLIDSYNRLLDEYEQVGQQLDVLNKSMDSYETIESAPSV